MWIINAATPLPVYGSSFSGSISNIVIAITVDIFAVVLPLTIIVGNVAVVVVVIN